MFIFSFIQITRTFEMLPNIALMDAYTLKYNTN